MNRWVLVDWHNGTTQAFLMDGATRRCIDLTSPEIDNIVKDKIAKYEYEIKHWQELLEKKTKKVNIGIDKDKI